MTSLIERRTVEPNVAHWTFKEGVRSDVFLTIYDELKAVLEQAEIDALVVVLAMSDPAADDLRQLWFNIGKTAEDAKVARIGVVTPPLDIMKKLAFEHQWTLGERTSEVRFGSAEEDLLKWCKG